MFDLILEVEGKAPLQLLAAANDLATAVQMCAVAAAVEPEPGEAERTTRIRVTCATGDSVVAVRKLSEAKVELGPQLSMRRGHKAKIMSATPFIQVIDWKPYNQLDTPQGKLARIAEVMASDEDPAAMIAIVRDLLAGVDPCGPSHLTPLRKWQPGIWLILGGGATYVRTAEADDKLEAAASVLDSIVMSFVQDSHDLFQIILGKLQGERETKDLIYKVCEALRKMKRDRNTIADAFLDVHRAAVAFVKIEEPTKADRNELKAKVEAALKLLRGTDADVQVPG